MRTQTGDDLIERILAHSADDAIVGEAANDLLNELFDGYPVESLGRLLHSGDDAAVRTTSWLLSELSEGAAPMMGELPALLAHPLRQVRFFAIEVVLANGDAGHGTTIAQVLNLSTDPDAAIRWKIIEFLTLASDDQLAAGASCLGAGQVRELTAWLIHQETEEPDPGAVVAGLDGDDAVARLFAAGVAARLSDEEPSLLEHAATVEDEQIRSFAQRWLGRSPGSG